MKVLFFYLALLAFWFFTENWVIDVSVPFVALSFLAVFVIRGFLFRKNRPRSFYLLVLLVTLVTLFMITDMIITYQKCRGKFEEVTSTMPISSDKIGGLVPFRKNSFLYSEKGVGTVCNIYVEYANLVFVKNPFFGLFSYSRKE